MQTFLPYPEFSLSFSVLDYKRLGKQRVEAMQIYNALEDINNGNIYTPKGKIRGWVNHPAVKMWRGYEDALALYHNKCIDAWVARGYNNTMKHIPIKGKIIMPFWVNWERFHSSHRSNLLRKDPVYYGKFGWTEPNNLEYVWP